MHASVNMCSLGHFLKDGCDKKTFTRSVSQKTKNEFTEEDMNLIKRRASYIDADFTICMHHEQLFLHKYGLNQKKCCDPMKKHKKSVKTSIREIALQEADSYVSLGIYVIPGQKLCPSCKIALNNKLKEQNVTPVPDIETKSSDEDDPDFTSDKVKGNL